MPCDKQIDDCLRRSLQFTVTIFIKYLFNSFLSFNLCPRGKLWGTGSIIEEHSINFCTREAIHSLVSKSNLLKYVLTLWKGCKVTKEKVQSYCFKCYCGHPFFVDNFFYLVGFLMILPFSRISSLRVLIFI